MPVEDTKQEKLHPLKEGYERVPLPPTEDQRRWARLRERANDPPGRWVPESNRR